MVPDGSRHSRPECPLPPITALAGSMAPLQAVAGRGRPIEPMACAASVATLLVRTALAVEFGVLEIGSEPRLRGRRTEEASGQTEDLRAGGGRTGREA